MYSEQYLFVSAVEIFLNDSPYGLKSKGDIRVEVDETKTKDVLLCVQLVC